MTDDEIQAHARRIARTILATAEFCWVYEDDDLLDAEDDWQEIHDYIIHATVNV